MAYLLRSAFWIAVFLTAGLVAAEPPTHKASESQDESLEIPETGSPLEEQNSSPKRRFIYKASRVESEKIDLRDIPVRSAQLIGRDVTVEGRVESINYAPEVRDGKTLHSLVVSDGDIFLRAVFAKAVLYNEGDFLRLQGALQKNPISGTPEILVVDVESVKPSEESYERWAKPYSFDTPGGVPTEVIPTPLSTAGEISAILAAIFGFFGIVGQVRDRRKSLILLPSEVSKSEAIEGRVVIRVRVFPSGKTPIALSDDINLKRGRYPFSKSWSIDQVRDQNSAPVRFPLILQGEKHLELSFQYSDEGDSAISGNWLLLWSSHESWKVFKNRLPWLQTILVASPEDEAVKEVRELQPSPESNVVAGKSSIYHSSTTCPRLKSAGQIRSVSKKEIKEKGLGLCKVCAKDLIQATESNYNV